MSAGWVGQFAPAKEQIDTLRAHLQRACPAVDVAGFTAAVVRSIAIYRSRVESPASSTQIRSRKRYLRALADGKPPRARVEDEFAETLRDCADLVAGDTRKAADALLKDLELGIRGRPIRALDDWLIFATAKSYSLYCPGMGLLDKSKFAKDVLPPVFWAAGIPTESIGRIRDAIERWQFGSIT